MLKATTARGGSQYMDADEPNREATTVKANIVQVAGDSSPVLGLPHVSLQ
jgi:hypothetical protein